MDRICLFSPWWKKFMQDWLKLKSWCLGRLCREKSGGSSSGFVLVQETHFATSVSVSGQRWANLESWLPLLCQGEFKRLLKNSTNVSSLQKMFSQPECKIIARKWWLQLDHLSLQMPPSQQKTNLLSQQKIDDSETDEDFDTKVAIGGN